MDEQVRASTPDPSPGAGSHIYRSYFRALKWSRLAMACFALLAALFVLWAIPWVPGGMSTEDYNEEVVLTFYLLGASIAAASVAVTFRILAAKRRAALMAWVAVYDEATGLYNRRYFMERVALECQRAALQDAAFSILLFAVVPSRAGEEGSARVTAEAMRMAGDRLALETRPTDLVGMAGPAELVVFAEGATRQAAWRVAQRLGESVTRRIDPGLEVLVGAAQFGSRLSDPDELLQAARASLTPLERLPLKERRRSASSKAA